LGINVRSCKMTTTPPLAFAKINVNENEQHGGAHFKP
jgi:hypothetical protein